eukprot:COSAG05_NODE_1182_length_5594_cov_31.189081_3_plen_223_part_00
MMSIFCQTYCDVSGTLSYIRIRTWVLFIQTQVWGYNIYIYIIILQARFFYIVTHIVHRHGYCLFQDLDFLRQRRIVFVTRFAIVFVHARGIAEKKTEPISRLGWGLGGLTGGGDIAGRAASPSYLPLPTPGGPEVPRRGPELVELGPPSEAQCHHQDITSTDLLDTWACTSWLGKSWASDRTSAVESAITHVYAVQEGASSDALESVLRVRVQLTGHARNNM